MSPIDEGRVRERKASCACSEVRVTTFGEPSIVHACSCFECQKRSGSSFTYTAFFASDAVQVEGETRAFRQQRDAGRWHESAFCVICGVSILSRLEAFPHLIGVAVGCFSDPDFTPPGAFYWAARRHRWLPTPRGVEVVQQQ